VVKNNKKTVAIFDFDGTLVEGHLWGAFLKENFKTKKRVFGIFFTICFFIIYQNLIFIPWKNVLNHGQRISQDFLRI
jgi:FMN phosphatase YigB (HAD superfamily)